RNLHDLDFARKTKAVLTDSSVDPSWLELEITENTVMSDPTRARLVLGELRDMGVRLTIDDFGTGYSSLTSLRDHIAQGIKIDKSFRADHGAPAERCVDRAIHRRTGARAGPADDGRGHRGPCHARAARRDGMRPRPGLPARTTAIGEPADPRSPAVGP